MDLLLEVRKLPYRRKPDLLELHQGRCPLADIGLGRRIDGLVSEHLPLGAQPGGHRGKEGMTYCHQSKVLGKRRMIRGLAAPRSTHLHVSRITRVLDPPSVAHILGASLLAGVFHSTPKSLGLMDSGTCFRRAKSVTCNQASCSCLMSGGPRWRRGASEEAVRTNLLNHVAANNADMGSALVGCGQQVPPCQVHLGHEKSLGDKNGMKDIQTQWLS